MFVVDANVFIYAVNEDAVHHRAARRWLDSALSANEAVGFAWLAVAAFVRITTHGRIMPSPLSIDDAMTQVEAWLSCPAAVVVEPLPHHVQVWSDLLRTAASGANLVNDAHLAALAIEHRATLVSFDRDFQRFAGLKTLVPDATDA